MRTGEETDAESTLYYLLMKVVKGQPVVDAYRQRAPMCEVIGVWNLHSWSKQCAIDAGFESFGWAFDVGCRDRERHRERERVIIIVMKWKEKKNACMFKNKLLLCPTSLIKNCKLVVVLLSDFSCWYSFSFSVCLSVCLCFCPLLCVCVCVCVSLSPCLETHSMSSWYW